VTVAVSHERRDGSPSRRYVTRSAAAETAASSPRARNVAGDRARCANELQAILSRQSDSTAAAAAIRQ
jgi:hypothetical protein